MSVEAVTIPDAVGQFWDSMRFVTPQTDVGTFDEFVANDTLMIRDDDDNLVVYHDKWIQAEYRRIKAEIKASGKKPWFLVVKARRVGITTDEMAENYWMLESGTHQYIISVADKTKNSRNIFRMMNRFYDNRDASERPIRSDSRTNMEFTDLDNLMDFDTGLGRSVARGSGLSKVHISEAARIDISVEQYQDFMSGFQAACKHGEIVLESTAQGAAGWFWEECQKSLAGNSPYSVIFLPWYMDPTNVIPVLEGEEIERTEDEKERSERLGPWTDEQIKYRREKMFEHGRLFPQEYPETIEEAFLVQEGCWFDVPTIKNLIPRCRAHEAEHDSGNLTVWHPPVEGEHYYIGVDTAEGLATGDASVAGVLDSKGRQCAVLYLRCPADVFGKKLAYLGRYYNDAYIAVEANNHGHSVINTLQNAEVYRNLYVHHDYDADPGSKGKVGFQTNAKTRPLILNAIKDEAVEGRAMEVNDRLFLGECMNFCLNSKGTKYEARQGAHDDRVMAWAIAWWVRQTAPREARAWVI